MSGGLHNNIENAYSLRVQKQAEKVRWIWQKHWEPPLTIWGCRNKQRRSGVFHKSIETATYRLRVQTQTESVRWTLQKHLEQPLTFWNCINRKVRWTLQKHWEQPLTSWGCRYKQRRSSRFYRSMEDNYLHAKGISTSREGQVDLTEVLRRVTYFLRVQKQAEKIKWTLEKHSEQPLTSWGCRHKQKRSDGLHESNKNSRLQAEDADTSREGQVAVTETWWWGTYMLKMQAQAEKVR